MLASTEHPQAQTQVLVEMFMELEILQNKAEEMVHNLAVKRGQVLYALNLAGMSYAQIALRTGLSRARVQQYVEFGRARAGGFDGAA